MSSAISLTNAVTSGDESAVATLLRRGADVNESTNGGQTALILAVIFGHTNIVRLLVRAGADPELRDNLGLNAIEWAKRRGLTEALEILTNGGDAGAARKKIVVNFEEPKKPVEEKSRATPKAEPAEKPSDDEKSKKWLAGLKQRLREQELRSLNRNEPPPERRRPEPESSVLSILPRETPPPVVETKPAAPEPVKTTPPVTARILEPPAQPAPTTGKRKRCPRCNATYNGELVSYCAHHIVPLVDADEPIPSEPPRKSVPLFWILLVITLSGSIVVGSLITTYLYKSNQAAARSAMQPNIQKGWPVVSQELDGKAVSLPEAECPVNGPEPLTGTVTVHVMVDKNGQVYWARGAGGDWLMRGASTEAAMKSTFSPEKLRGRETEGTITYTFKAQ
ncbi:MAG TPA: ankyrin repeat domain-containing protein [Pyrinomonadaceae bacterium]|nr:ankyrin repeat domain-containing protein [Pyrinomonadaceae bacterium]